MNRLDSIGILHSEPWALQREFLANLALLVSIGARSLDVPAAVRSSARRETPARAARGRIAVLPLYSVITQRGDFFGGGSSVEVFKGALRDAVSDETIESIVIEIDSPGGHVYGVGELANEIYQARAKKPIVAIANSVAASAAYWIGSAASRFYMTPGGEVGSIGVWAVHEDWSKNLEKGGIKVTLISAGKYKTEGNAYEPLKPEGREFMQSRIDDYYTAFVRDVARGRAVPVATVRGGMGQGRLLGAAAALKEGMVDEIATFSQVIQKLQRGDLNSKSTSQGAAQRPTTTTHRLKLAELDILLAGGGRISEH